MFSCLITGFVLTITAHQAAHGGVRDAITVCLRTHRQACSRPAYNDAEGISRVLANWRKRLGEKDEPKMQIRYPGAGCRVSSATICSAVRSRANFRSQMRKQACWMSSSSVATRSVATVTR